MTKLLTFIGNGNMALAMAKALEKEYEIEVVGRSLENLKTFSKALENETTMHLLDDFDMTDKTLIFCVKPANLESVGTKLKGKAAVVYSVLAGTKLKSLEENLNAHAFVRAMPNVAASVAKSMTTLTGDESFKASATTLFNAIGQTLWLTSEKELDIATALAGSGPAYLALIAEALTDGAVKQGLKRTDAMVIMRGLFEGFGTLVQNQHPALLKDSVMSPGGTTAAGYSALEAANVRSGCIQAIEKAYEVTKK